MLCSLYLEKIKITQDKNLSRSLFFYISYKDNPKIWENGVEYLHSTPLVLIETLPINFHHLTVHVEKQKMINYRIINMSFNLFNLYIQILCCFSIKIFIC